MPDPNGPERSPADRAREPDATGSRDGKPRRDGQGPRAGGRGQERQPERRGEDTRAEGQEDGSAGQVRDNASRLRSNPSNFGFRGNRLCDISVFFFFPNFLIWPRDGASFETFFPVEFR